MNEIVVKDSIEKKIYEIRGVQVMLDSDLAELYKCANGTKDINKAVKRNINRFPKDFYFELTYEECSRFQIGTLKGTRGSNIKYLPHVFTEQGVAMLSSVLHTDVAINVSIEIMRAFVYMRKYISTNLIEQKYINNLVLENRENIKLLQKSFDKLNDKQKVSTIFFKGQIFDAYVVMKKICNTAKKEIIIIDNYAGKELFDLLKDIDKKIIVITNNINEEDYKKYKSQYNNITINKSDIFHDRFIIIDRRELYHSGASFKDLGKKCFAINKIEDERGFYGIMKLVNKK